MKRDVKTLDLVEALTGDRYAHACDEAGHDWQIDGPIKEVRHLPAAFLLCARCGERGYHWLSPKLQAQAKKEGLWEWKTWRGTG